MSSYTIEGRVISVGQTEQKSEKFSVRKFVVDDEAPEYANLHEFQLSNAKTTLADGLTIGTRVKVHFNIRGRAWTSPSGEVKYFSSLDAWKVEVINAASEQSVQQVQQSVTESDLPF